MLCNGKSFGKSAFCGKIEETDPSPNEPVTLKLENRTLKEECWWLWLHLAKLRERDELRKHLAGLYSGERRIDRTWKGIDI